MYLQVDDQQEEHTRGAPEKEGMKKKEEDINENRYKGYEVLLDFEEDPTYSPPKGTVKAEGSIIHILFSKGSVVKTTNS